jgi:hypothetical protein
MTVGVATDEMSDPDGVRAVCVDTVGGVDDPGGMRAWRRACAVDVAVLDCCAPMLSGKRDAAGSRSAVKKIGNGRNKLRRVKSMKEGCNHHSNT